MNATLYKILNTQSETYNSKAMASLMFDLLTEAGASIEIDAFDNLFATKGTPPAGQFYPCIAAHLDTVHSVIDAQFYSVLELGGKAVAMHNKTLQFAGIGGDDKCGLYIAIQALRSLDFCKVALFADEEAGCDGSGAASLDFFADCAYVLENDRRGAVDVVRNIMGTELASRAFCDTIEPLFSKYGRKWCNTGGLTDVYTLATRGLGISSLNIACAYYQPHQPEEFINIQELESTLRFNLELIDMLGSSRYEHKAERVNRWGQHYQTSYQRPKPQRTGYQLPEEAPKVCTFCNLPSLEGDAWGHWCTSCGAYVYEGGYSYPMG